MYIPVSFCVSNKSFKVNLSLEIVGLLKVLFFPFTTQEYVTLDNTASAIGLFSYELSVNSLNIIVVLFFQVL